MPDKLYRNLQMHRRGTSLQLQMRGTSSQKVLKEVRIVPLRRCTAACLPLHPEYERLDGR